MVKPVHELLPEANEWSILTPADLVHISEQAQHKLEPPEITIPDGENLSPEERTDEFIRVNFLLQLEHILKAARAHAEIGDYEIDHYMRMPLVDGLRLGDLREALIDYLQSCGHDARNKNQQGFPFPTQIITDMETGQTTQEQCALVHLSWDPEEVE